MTTINQHPEFTNLNRLWAFLIINFLENRDIQDFYPSPGMRNAPFLWALGQTKHHYYSGRDERSQGFLALGSSKLTQRPSVLFCTSGSALTHYWPALVEADKSGTPIIIISSDRPLDLVNNNANQTMHQKGIFAPYLRAELNLSSPNEEIRPRKLKESIDRLISRAVSPGKSGPVHINISFAEPLGNQKGPLSTDYLNQSLELLNNQQGLKRKSSKIPGIDQISSFLKEIRKTIKNAKNPLLVLGELNQQEERSSLEAFLHQWQGAHYADIASGLKFYKNQKQGAIPNFDHPEVYKKITISPPDLILHIGGRTTSKHYERFLEENPSINVYHIQESPHPVNPGGAINQSYSFSPATLAKELSGTTWPQSKKLIDWSQLIKQKEKYIDNAPLCYPSITKASIEEIQDESTLFIGNSTFIRSFNSYASLEINKRLFIYCNRGLSGIEGNLSTAIGIQKASNKPLIQFIGDISLFHDLNALYVAKELQSELLLIVAVNKQGGIFNLLPISDDPQAKSFMKSLTTPLNIDWKSIIEALHIPVKSLNSLCSYRSALQTWQDGPSLQVLLLEFDDNQNKAVYNQLRTIKL